MIFIFFYKQYAKYLGKVISMPKVFISIKPLS